jgi:putative transposase
MRHRRLPRLDLRGRTYFLTCCLDGRRRLLARPDLAELVTNLYVAQRDRGHIALHGYVIMPDHYHVLLTVGDEVSISNVVRTVHSLSTQAGRRTMEIRGRIWQSRFYDHVVRDEDDFRAKLDYLHNNPLRAGLVEDVTAYPWSSLRFWETGAGPVACDCWD